MFLPRLWYRTEKHSSPGVDFVMLGIVIVLVPQVNMVMVAQVIKKIYKDGGKESRVNLIVH